MRTTLIPGLPDVNDLDNAQVEKFASLDNHLLHDTKPNEIHTDLDLLAFLDQVRKSLKEVLPAGSHKPSDHFRLPYQLGRFQLLEHLGEGGQGVVFRANDPNRGVDVAIKLLNTAGRQWDTQRQIRFRREARITSRINNTHVSSVLEASQVDGTSYIVMPYCPGPSLAQWLSSRQGRSVPIADAVKLMQVLTSAVVSCHSHGILHRDLKPGNVLLFPVNDQVPRDAELKWFEPQICDFGLSRAEDDDGDAITGSHTVLGSRAYMSPEQAEGKQVELSTATDLWALGVILYELVTGQKPFGDDGRTLIRILTGAPINPRQLRHDMPKDLEAIILKCLSKSISQRYSTVSAFGDDLKLFSEGKPTQARPLKWTKRVFRLAKQHPWKAATAACVLLTLSVFAYAIIRYEYQLRSAFVEVTAKKTEAENSASQLQDSVYAMTMREVTDLIKRGKEDVALDKLLAFIPQGDTARDRRELSWRLLHHQLLDRPFTILPKKTSRLHRLGKGFDHQHLLSEGDNQLFLWDINTGLSSQLLSTHGYSLWGGDHGRGTTSNFFEINRQSGVVSASSSNQSTQECLQFSIQNNLDTTRLSGCNVSNNKRWFAGSLSNSGLLLHNYETGMQRVLPWPWLPRVNGVVSWCTFSPDSRKVVVYSKSFQPQLLVCSVEEGSFIGHLDLGPVSNLIALSILDNFCWCGFDNGKLIQFNLNDLKIINEWKLTRPETYRLKNPATFDPPAYSSPEEGIWILGRTDGEVVEINLSNGKEKVLTRHQGPVTFIVSDGKQRIMTVDSHEARLIDRINGNLIKSWPVPGELAGDDGLAFLTHGVYYPEDNKLIHGGLDGRLAIWRLEAANSQKAIRHGSREAWAVRFSPDNQTLVTAGEGNIHFWNRFTGERIRTLKGHFGFIEAVVFSPDGRTLATGSSERSVAIWNYSNGELIKEYTGLKQSVRSVAISPNGQWLAAGLKKQKQDSGDSANIVMWNLVTGDKVAEWKAHEDHVRALVFSPDSKLLYSGSEDNLIKTWETSTRQLVNTTRDIQEVWHLRVHQDRLISAGAGNCVSIWSLANGTLVQRFRDPDSAIRALALSPDGRTIVTGGETGLIRIWLTANGQELTSIDVGKEKVLSLDISSDGRSIAVGCVSGKVIVLETGTAGQ